MCLEVKNLSKNYNDKSVVRNMSFRVERGKAVGLLGRNGAGKTTTIRMILDIISKDSGEVILDGKKIDYKTLKFGYLPEERGLYPKDKVKDQLLYFAKLKGMTLKKAEESFEKYMKVFKMEEYKNLTLEKLSKGNQQKIQLISVLLHDPELIILDEPFSGLDPVNTETLKMVIEELIRENKMIIFSSHMMNQVEEFCQDIVLIDNGEIVLSGNLDKIKSRYGYKYAEVSTVENIDKVLLEAGIKCIRKNPEKYYLEVNCVENYRRLIKNLVDKKILFLDTRISRPSLYDIFIEKVGDKV